jgi:hypothetical protein
MGKAKKLCLAIYEELRKVKRKESLVVSIIVQRRVGDHVQL